MQRRIALTLIAQASGIAYPKPFPIPHIKPYVTNMAPKDTLIVKYARDTPALK